MFSDHLKRTLSWLPLTVLVGAGLVACEDYNAPPSVTLAVPEGGNYTTGQPVVLEFSEPVAYGTLSVSIWPDERNIEQELPASSTPHISRCTPSSSPCGELTLTLSEDRTSAIMEFDPEGLGAPDVPLLVEVHQGLADGSGADTGQSLWFDFLFKPDLEQEDACAPTVAFQSGTYLIVGSIDQPLPATLRLWSDIVVLEDGTMAIAAGEVDNIDGAPKNTTNPDEVVLDVDDDGFAIHATGQVCANPEDGSQFFRTDPVDVNISIGPIGITLEQVRLEGDILPDPDLPGSDMIDGRLTFEGLLLISGNLETPYDPGGTTFVGKAVPEDKAIEEAPKVCGDTCGATVQCNPPADFPGDGICP